MLYSEMIDQAIARKNLSLSQVCMKLAQSGIWMDRSTLSKLRNGKIPPAKDNLNIALSSVIGVDPVELRLAAAREVIPPELYELIRTAG